MNLLRQKITKSNIPIENTLARIDIFEEQLDGTLKTHLKCERPVGSKDKNS